MIGLINHSPPNGFCFSLASASFVGSTSRRLLWHTDTPFAWKRFQLRCSLIGKRATSCNQKCFQHSLWCYFYGTSTTIASNRKPPILRHTWSLCLDGFGGPAPNHKVGLHHAPLRGFHLADLGFCLIQLCHRELLVVAGCTRSPQMSITLNM